MTLLIYLDKLTLKRASFKNKFKNDVNSLFWTKSIKSIYIDKSKKSMAGGPRKFSEKIALLNQKEAEVNAAFNSIMGEIAQVVSRF